MMGIAIVIMGGLALMTVFASIGSYFTEKRKHASGAGKGEMEALVKRMESLEAQVQSRDERIERLENDVSFATRLLEDKRP
jgi:uncharacterized protein YlxW (UPF0749 family)